MVRVVVIDDELVAEACAMMLRAGVFETSLMLAVIPTCAFDENHTVLRTLLAGRLRLTVDDFHQQPERAFRVGDVGVRFVPDVTGQH